MAGYWKTYFDIHAHVRDQLFTQKFVQKQRNLDSGDRFDQIFLLLKMRRRLSTNGEICRICRLFLNFLHKKT